MRNDLQAAVDKIAIISEWANRFSVDHNYLGANGIKAMDTALAALRDMMRRREGCAMCRGIVRAEKIDMILAYKADGGIAGLSEISCNYCPRCGRQLSGNPEQGEGI